MRAKNLEHIILERTQKAVLDFAGIETLGLARRVVRSLRRVPASGIFGDDYAYKSLWDEYCHEVQHGPHEALEIAWSEAIHPFIHDIVERVPPHVGKLITILAAWDLGERQEAEIVGSIWPEGINKLVRASLRAMAASRNIDRFRNL